MTTSQPIPPPCSEEEVTALPLLAASAVALLNLGGKVRHRNARSALQLNRVEQRLETTKSFFFSTDRKERAGSASRSKQQAAVFVYSVRFTRRTGARVW